MSGYIKDILEHATSQGYRSNVLKILLGLIIILLLASMFLFYINQAVAGFWVLGATFIFLVIFAYSFLYCLMNNPDLLRSEKFNLEKTALGKISFTGDSTTGKLKIPDSEYVLIESKGENSNENN